MAKRKPTTTIADRAELEQVFGEYAETVLEEAKVSVDLERALQAVRVKFEPRLAACKETREGLFEDIQSFAVLHPELFETKKSIDLVHGTIGFRTGTPAVKTLPKVKADYALQLAINRLPDCIRTVQELDKETILGRFAEGKLTQEQLATCGLQIERKEAFYADVKHEEGGE